MKPAQLTENDALFLNVEKYKNLPTAQARRGMLEWVGEAARMHPQLYTKQFNQKLLPLLREAETALAKGKKPEMPTRAEFMLLFSWIGNGLAIVILRVGTAVAVVVFLVLAALGLGDAMFAFFAENKWIFGGAIAAGALALLFSGLELGKGEAGGGGTTHERFEQETFYQKTTYEKTTSHN